MVSKENVRQSEYIKFKKYVWICGDCFDVEKELYNQGISITGSDIERVNHEERNLLQILLWRM